MSYKLFAPSLTIITSLYATDKVQCCRKKELSFWQKLQLMFWDFNPWLYTPVEFYEVEVPSIIYDEQNNQVICHPSLRHEIMKVMEDRA